MTTEQWRQVKEIFESALERENPDRMSFIVEASAGDEILREAAERMLGDWEQAGDFLESPALVDAGLVAPMLDPVEAEGRRIGPYKITGEIGRGGMSVVYLAERADDVYDKRVAIKLVWAGADGTEIAQKFQRERQILAHLDHPHIARLLDGGVTEEGWQYVVMEYVDGAPITEYCDQQKLSVNERLRLFQEICEAVQYSHQNLVVHRDLKPSNILVTREGSVKLLDFGVAKILDQGLEDSSAAQPPTVLNFLTPEYASPEHLRGERITTASDVYSLGVLLYELLTGQRPFEIKTRSPQELIRLIEEREPLRPSLAARSPVRSPAFRRDEDEIGAIPPEGGTTNKRSDEAKLRGDLDNIILKALQKDPPRRYQSPRQLSEDITRHLNGEPVTARDATLAYRLGKHIRRNRGWSLTLAVVLLALIGGLIVSRQQLRAARERDLQQRRELYAADMRQAGADWSEGNLVHMDELLERHRPGNGIDDDWRGFEWFALWKLLHTEKFTLPHQAWVPTVVYTPDGKTILTGSRDGRIEMWDAQNGQSLGLLATFPEGVGKLLFSNDGKKLVAAGYFGRVGIWDFASRRLAVELPPSIQNGAWLAISPNGKRLAVRFNTYPLRPIDEWDTDTGQLLATYALPPQLGKPLDGPALYSIDGKLLCLTQRDRHWELLDVATRRSIARLDPQSDNPLALVPFGPAGNLLSHDGQRLYLPTRDFLTRVWDIRSGKLLHVFTGHQDNVETPAISYDDKLLATGSDDKTLRLWDTQTGKLLATVRNESQTFSPAFSPDNKFLAAVCMRAFRVKVWDVAQLLATRSVYTGLDDVVLAPDGKTFLADEPARDRTVLCDLLSGQPIFTYSAIASRGSGDNAASFSPDGKLFTLRRDSDPSVVEVLETASGKSLAILNGHHLVLDTAFSPDGKTLATTGYEQITRLWDTATWREHASLVGHTDRVWCVSFSPDGSKLATSGYDDTIRVWDAASGKELMTLRSHRAWVKAVKFSPDGKLLASASWDYTIKLWDVATGRELRTLTGHANSVYCLAFSPDGQRLASGGDDRTVRVWDVKTGEQLTALHGHTDKVWQVFFTPDGQTLISSSEQETRLWRAATLDEVRARK